MVWIVTFGGRFLSIVTLLNITMSIYAVRRLLGLFLSRSASEFIAALIFLTPLFALFSVSFWHDIPMTWGFLLIVLICVETDSFSIQLKNSQKWLLLLGILGILCRQNGPVTVFLFLIIAGLFGRSKQTWKIVAALSSLIICLEFGLPLVLESKAPATASSSLATLFADIQCVAQKNPSAIPVKDWNYLTTIAPREVWENPLDCTSINPVFWNKLTDKNRVDQDPKRFIKTWWHVSKVDLNDVLKGRVGRAQSFIPAPFVSSPGNMYMLQDKNVSEFPIRSILKQNQSIENIISAVNVTSFIFGWSGLWFSLSMIWLLALRGILSHRSMKLLFASEFCLQLPLVINSPALDARYGLYTLWLSMTLFLVSMLKIFSKKGEPFKSAN